MTRSCAGTARAKYASTSDATLPATGSRTRHDLDWLGALTLASALCALVLVADLGGSLLPWTSPVLLSLAAGAILLLVAFVRIERRAAEPILPLGLLRDLRDDFR